MLKLNFTRSGRNDRRESLGNHGRAGRFPEKTDEQLAKTDAQADDGSDCRDAWRGLQQNQGKPGRVPRDHQFSEMDDHHLEEFLYRTTFKTPKTIAREFFFNLMEINPDCGREILWKSFTVGFTLHVPGH